MKNAFAWTESKYANDRRGNLRAGNVPVTSKLIVDLLAETYAKLIDQYAYGRLADLGCGKVPLYGVYRDKVTEVVCIDWPGSPHDRLHVDIFADLNEPLNLEESSFDTVLATDVIEHLHTPQAFFASAARVLKPGGKLIIGVPFLYWIHEQPNDFYRYTRFALEKLTKDVGLDVIALFAYGGAPEVLADIATKSLASRPRLAKVFYRVARFLLRVPPVQRLSLGTRDTMPMGYVLVAKKPHLR